MKYMRSEGSFGWMRRREEKQPLPTPRDKWLTVGLKANIEWPQAFEIIAISLANEILSEGDFDFAEFMASEAEPEQVEKIRAAAKAAHEIYEIKVRWKWLLMSKYRIKQLWRQYRESTAHRLVTIWNALSSDADQIDISLFGSRNMSRKERSSAIADLSAELRDPSNAEKVLIVRQVLQVFLDVLRSQEGQVLAEDYKRMIQEQKRGPIPLFGSLENIFMTTAWVKKFHQLVREQLQTSKFDNLPPEVKAAVLRLTA